MLVAIVLPVALAFFALLVVNLIGIAGDMLVVRGGLMLAVQDGAGMARAMQSGGAGGLYNLADEAAVRQVVDTVARENLDVQGYDPTLLDGALASGCEAGDGPCIYVASGARVTGTGEEPGVPGTAPATPTPVEGGVGW